MQVNIDGQKFDLEPDVLNGILEAAAQTEQDGVEHGFLMCKTPEGITSGKKCTGDKCQIMLTDCKKAGGYEIGSFHSHPEVISFSLGDYVTSAHNAKDGKYLLCVSLENQGVRCKALKKPVPEQMLMALSHMQDSDGSRGLIKPYYTQKVNISNEAIKLLAEGTPWEQLPESHEVCAIDEGPEHMHGDITCAEKEKETPVVGGTMEDDEVKTLLQAAAKWQNNPTGKYPWGTKTFTQSIKLPKGGVGLEKIPAPKLESKTTEFIPINSIEMPDPSLIHIGEVAGYINALSPIIMTKKKDDKGKWIILDGRHRLAAWRSAGYRQVPVVWAK